MVTVCAWCQKYMGSMEPFHDPAISHGICPSCIERDSLSDSPVLVVSPSRAPAIPMLQTLLRGAPEIAIVVDRRAGERRGDLVQRRSVSDAGDRRATDRRRAPSLYLV
jgi:hypothetical protein